MEYAIVFPIQLMITLAIIQLAHIFIAKQVLEYAAFCGARAAVVGLEESDSKRAAVVPISKITGTTGASTDDTVELPGWGLLRGSAAADEKTTVTIVRGLDGEQTVIHCALEHEYELRIPIGGAIVYRLGDTILGLDSLDYSRGAPHLRMKGSCSLAQPWGG